MLENAIGRLEVITGSMFSGKSEELIRRIRRAKYAKQRVIVFSPSIDKRYGENAIYSHNKNNVEAYSVYTTEQMEHVMSQNTDAEVIGIDEIQFFPPEVVEFCKKYVELGKRIVVAGLDLDFRAKPFVPLPELMAIADEVSKLSAICMICGKPGYASQRLINGEPAYEDDPLVLVGASENYEARCRRHHKIRIRNSQKVPVEIIINTHKLDNSEILKNLNIRDYKIIEVKAGTDVCELRKLIDECNGKVVLNIFESIVTKMERNYTIINFISEYRKNSNITLVSQNKDAMVFYLQTIADILMKNDLKVKKIFMDNIEIKGDELK
ncbi:thymidine kinase [Caviibacter abscessus]|uniref:thymidine kinase n=1 Tax=Caviibacter abscessus TaxID=1766719 RepID=UPI00082966A0|nr:thymidine kinase [Caviibacter abscessus]